MVIVIIIIIIIIIMYNVLNTVLVFKNVSLM
jgi:hypothetical protein